MKKLVLTLINLLIFSLLIPLNVWLIIEKGLSNDGWLVIVLAGICLVIYVLGLIFPNKTVYLIHKISEKMYQNSTIVEIPSLSDAEKIFKKRLICLLITVNILLVLLIITFFWK